jgi:hypothetical protein
MIDVNSQAQTVHLMGANRTHSARLSKSESDKSQDSAPRLLSEGSDKLRLASGAQI